MVDEFLDSLFEWEQKYQEAMPDEIKEAYFSLADVEEDVFNVNRTQKQQLKRFLKNYLQFPCYGFNSGKHPFSKLHVTLSHWAYVTLSHWSHVALSHVALSH